MDSFQITAMLVTLAAVLAFVNHKVLRLPTSIGLMALSLVVSLGLIAVTPVAPGLGAWAESLLAGIDFNEALMQGMLGFLLFAGALHVDLAALWDQRWAVGLLASVGVLISTAIVGGLTWAITQMLAIDVPVVYCLLFGSLISPTDPIAVLGILKTLGAPRDLEVRIAGESLFNDGVGVVVFMAILGVAGLGGGHGEGPGDGVGVPSGPGHLSVPAAVDVPAGDHVEAAMDAEAEEHVDAGSVAWLFLQEAVGGAVFGLLVGLMAYWMLRRVDAYAVEILISLALVAGGYALAMALHLSGPIAMVVAGLLIGNHGRALAMSPTTREHLDLFWEMVDEILNAVLFVLIGLEVLVLTFSGLFLEAGLLAIPAVLLARFTAVGLPLLVLRPFRARLKHATKVLTWGGLRGGISVALALSLRETLGRQRPEVYEVLLFMTYAVVVFSILVQGLTVGPLLRRLGLQGGPDEVSAAAH